MLCDNMERLAFLVLLCVFIGCVEGNCKKNFGGCDKKNGLCWTTGPSTHFCTCKAGFRFLIPTTRRGRCVDVNECKTKSHACDTTHGRCINTHGSYRCVCNRYYMHDYTKTKCLLRRHVHGTCRYRARRRHDVSKMAEFLELIQYDSNEEKSSRRRCKCEPGFYRTRKCALCRDINECRKGISLCDRKHGTCHNSQGGYYCKCKVGYVLGPCGYKCYTPATRPARCTSSSISTSHLIKGDNDGLQNEVTMSQVLDFITEKAAYRGKTLLPIKSDLFAKCKTPSTKTQKLDLNNDKKIDVTIVFVCKQGTYRIKSFSDKEAYWTQWTCWTQCRPTCSGGLQTRSRICKNGLVGYGKCKGAATQYKECYKGRKCPMRVRREANTLSKTQQNDLIQAMKKYKKDTSTAGFHNAASTHFWPNQCMGTNGAPSACCAHGAKLNFAMWHRAELLNFEAGLSRHLKDKTLGLPYWNWVTYANPPALVWNKKVNGKTNPFTKSVVRVDLASKNTTQRSPRVDASQVALSKSNYYVATQFMNPHTIHEFSELLETAHNTIHASICTSAPGRTCTISMGSLTYAAFDPVFFFHHTNVDRLFSIFGKKMIDTKSLSWTRQSVLEPQENIYHFNEPFYPFGNKSLTPFKNVRVLNSIQDLFYEKELLGYKYDNLVEAVPATIAQAQRQAASGYTLTLAQFERSIGTNLKIRYFLANKLTGAPPLPTCSLISDTDPRFLGSLQILGSKGEKKWKNHKPTMLSIHSRLTAGLLGEALQQMRFGPFSNVLLQVCYTKNVTCTASCKEAPKSVTNRLPSPDLILYPGRRDVEIYRIEWASNIRHPPWGINLNVAKQWIHFWGSEVKNVVQVNCARKYRTCNARGGKKVNCTTGSCILQKGVHYFIHKTKSHCRKGLKLKIYGKI